MKTTTDHTIIGLARALCRTEDESTSLRQALEVANMHADRQQHEIATLEERVERCAKAKAESDKDSDEEVDALQREIEELQRARDSRRLERDGLAIEVSNLGSINTELRSINDNIRNRMQQLDTMVDHIARLLDEDLSTNEIALQLASMKRTSRGGNTLHKWWKFEAPNEPRSP